LDHGRAVWVPSDPIEEVPSSVQVVFETNSSKWQMNKDEGDEWSLNFADTGLEPGVYTFFFLVDGLRSLSRRHATAGRRNAALFSGPLRRYLENKGGKKNETITDSPSAKWGRANSCMEPTPKAATFARPHSISHNLASLAGAGGSSDEEDLPGASMPVKGSLLQAKVEPFPDEIYEGLWDPMLKLRMHGFALPPAESSPSEPLPPPRLRFKPGAWRIGKPSGLECEDAYFANMFSLGVADGVGSMVQFARFGVNSAAYATDLMEIAEATMTSSPSSSEVPAEQRALDACRAAEEKSTKFGASTISVMALEGSTVGCANLGDSGFMILRKGSAGMTIIHKSVDQQHGWNCPYQLMRIPPVLAAKFPNFPQDHAADSDTYSYEVEEGDLILLFSDGMRDNLHAHEILSIVDRSLSPAFAGLAGFASHASDPEDVARALAQAAHARSRDPRARVPFTLYSLEHGYDCLGGKEDDITVVAAWLVPDELDEMAVEGLE